MTESETIVVVGCHWTVNSTEYPTISEPFSVSPYCSKRPPSDTSVNYASPWAGAHYRPVPGSSPQALREAGQALRTYEFMKRVAVDEPASGVQFIKGIEYLEAPPPEYLDEQSVRNSYSHLDGLRYLSAKERPAGVVWGVEYDTYVVNSPVYCAYMLRKFILKGGSMRKYTLASLKEAFSLASNVRNRGQTCLVRNLSSATITRQNSDGSWSFCIPRPLDGGTIIGGTKQPHNWDPHPSPEIRATLLANAAKWFPFTPESEGKFDVIHDIVGRRPAREGGMRLEVEKVGSEQFIVHAYGAGGRGFEISRGVAEDTTALMLDHGFLHPKAAL
ncbi:hypothetical protein N7468_001424 [Penicillium chermesinum]|uniref:FAD dependent oxidoreductase domain-containing protein n=1 Tax=Penicillium chermesinum TaxID=63820 RepID=A0A9W9TWJ5_9EURO|nr:uncharacterized protein N7468_001424 [Penicillium chermesinum]KAJ5246441.1 hypothetical protein N7468_001424 [Penicillium chermesinum]